jgi:hypothetical protein
MYESPSITTSLDFTCPFSQGAGGGFEAAPSASVVAGLASDPDERGALASPPPDCLVSPPELDPEEPELDDGPDPDDDDVPELLAPSSPDAALDPW